MHFELNYKLDHHQQMHYSIECVFYNFTTCCCAVGICRELTQLLLKRTATKQDLIFVCAEDSDAESLYLSPTLTHNVEVTCIKIPAHCDICCHNFFLWQTDGGYISRKNYLSQK
jgi:hypothetical protein